MDHLADSTSSKVGCTPFLAGTIFRAKGTGRDAQGGASRGQTVACKAMLRHFRPGAYGHRWRGGAGSPGSQRHRGYSRLGQQGRPRPGRRGEVRGGDLTGGSSYTATLTCLADRPSRPRGATRGRDEGKAPFQMSSISRGSHVSHRTQNSPSCMRSSSTVGSIWGRPDRRPCALAPTGSLVTECHPVWPDFAPAEYALQRAMSARWFVAR
jgi:hypothetical protein